MHVVMYSGGAGSWATAKRVANMLGEPPVLLFADTLVEHKDLYRFLVQSAANVQGITVPPIDPDSIPPMHEPESRRARLAELAKEYNERIPCLRWIMDGRHPWQVFRDSRFIGNNRIARCSHDLKQSTCRKWMDQNADAATIYVGIDWTETHRIPAIERNWQPYKVGLPMTEAPFWDKLAMIEALQAEGISPPVMYAQGFPHNNCAGACVRGGQANWANLWRHDLETYLWHEQQELEVQQYLGTESAILREVRQGETFPLPLTELRRRLESRTWQIDLFDIGGCGCFTDSD